MRYIRLIFNEHSDTLSRMPPPFKHVLVLASGGLGLGISVLVLKQIYRGTEMPPILAVFLVGGSFLGAFLASRLLFQSSEPAGVIRGFAGGHAVLALGLLRVLGFGRDLWSYNPWLDVIWILVGGCTVLEWVRIARKQKGKAL